MILLYISDLQRKDIVNIADGQNLGRIIDIEINEKGQILNLVVEKKKLLRAINNSTDTNVSYDKVERIGEDVILVRV